MEQGEGVLNLLNGKFDPKDIDQISGVFHLSMKYDFIVFKKRASTRSNSFLLPPPQDA